jgi:hypothetical protein
MYCSENVKVINRGNCPHTASTSRSKCSTWNTSKNNRWNFRMNVGFCKYQISANAINQSSCVMTSSSELFEVNIIYAAVIVRICFNCTSRQTFYCLELRLIDKQLLDSMKSNKDQVICLSQQRLSNCSVAAAL